MGILIVLCAIIVIFIAGAMIVKGLPAVVGGFSQLIGDVQEGGIGKVTMIYFERHPFFALIVFLIMIFWTCLVLYASYEQREELFSNKSGGIVGGIIVIILAIMIGCVGLHFLFLFVVSLIEFQGK
jgi:hypothetical protein